MKTRTLVYAMTLGICVGVVGFADQAADAAVARTLTLKWAPDPSVMGYEVYYGKTADSGRMRQLPVPYDLNLSAPAVQFNILRDLKVLRGQSACFRVRAYDSVSKSPLSSAVCTKV